MKLTEFAVLAAVAFTFAGAAQTISGYTDGGRPVSSRGAGAPNAKWLDYPGTPVEGWQATLRLPTNTFRMGRDLVAEIVIRNASSNQLTLSAAWPLLANGFSVQVLDKDKVEIPLTEFGRAEASSGTASPNVSRRLQPGEEMALSLDLHRFYRLESPGVFTIQATKSLSSPDKSHKLQAATGVAQVTIQPAPGPQKN